MRAYSSKSSTDKALGFDFCSVQGIEALRWHGLALVTVNGWKPHGLLPGPNSTVFGCILGIVLRRAVSNIFLGFRGPLLVSPAVSVCHVRHRNSDLKKNDRLLDELFRPASWVLFGTHKATDGGCREVGGTRDKSTKSSVNFHHEPII